MSARRSRMSLGPGSAMQPLGDDSARANRRTSFSGNSSDEEGGGGVDDATTKKQAHRAMLDE